MNIHPCFTKQLKPTWRPFLLADMVICNEWYVEVAIALYDKCSHLDHAIILQFGSRGQFGCYNWGLQETQFVLLGTQVSIPRKTVSNCAKYLLRLQTEEQL